jgi:hypothetical protein
MTKSPSLGKGANSAAGNASDSATVFDSIFEALRLSEEGFVGSGAISSSKESNPASMG